MARIIIIFNPQANRGDNHKIRDLLYDLLVENARQAASSGSHYDLQWIATEYPGHATELALQAAQDGADTVIAIGGDGTVHEVINGMMQVDDERRPRLGILPTGTGNDLAVNFGLATDFEEAARSFFQPHTRPLDVGLASNETGRRVYWVNTLGFGFSGAVTVVARSSRSILRGFALYLYIVLKTILFHLQNHDIGMALDDAEPERHAISMVNICNGPAEGGGFPVAPHAVMDDGLLSFTVMRRMSRLQLLRFLPVVLAAKHPEHPQYFKFGNARRVAIESRLPMDVHVDGEMFSDGSLRRFTVEMIPAALRVLCTAS